MHLFVLTNLPPADKTTHGTVLFPVRTTWDRVCGDEIAPRKKKAERFLVTEDWLVMANGWYGMVILFFVQTRNRNTTGSKLEESR